VKLDRRHLHRPDHAGELGDAQLVGVATGRKLDADGVDPGRSALREPLLVDLLALDASREAVQHAGPFPQRAHDPVADADVVAGQVELGLAAGGEVHPVGAGDPHSPLAHLEINRRCAVWRRHGH
jgi:hypothetical protein